MAEGQTEGAGRTGVCRHCGALVGAGEARCMVCGTSVARPEEQSRRAPHADPETLRFLRAVVSRPATFTFAFLVANVFLYVLMWLSGGATGAVLLAYGAKANYLIDQGQWWRFVTPIFLHMLLPGYGWVPVHLLLNMYGLFILGQLVERLYGSAKFVVFWVLTGVAGVVTSYLVVQPEWAQGTLGRLIFRAYDSPSAGASGALFGLMGVLFVFGIRYREELPEDFKSVFGFGLLPVLLLNLLIGFMRPGFAGNAPHVGGLLAGMGLALLVGYNRPGARAARGRAWQAAQVACLVLVAVSFLMVARHFNAPPPRFSNLGGAPVQPYVDAVNAGQNAILNFLRGDPSALPAAAQKLGQAPAPSSESDALREELKAYVARARETADDKSLKPEEREERLRQLEADLHGWQERFAQWVKTEGREYHLNMQEPDEPGGEKK